MARRFEGFSEPEQSLEEASTGGEVMTAVKKLELEGKIRQC
jgi:hypothetical protein